MHKLPELTAEHKNQIQGALGSGPSQEILIEGFGLHITRKDLRTLKGFNWLNDEVIAKILHPV